MEHCPAARFDGLEEIFLKKDCQPGRFIYKTSVQLNLKTRNMKTTTILSTIVLAFALSVPTAYSAEKKKPAETSAVPAKKEEAKKTDHIPLYGQVVSMTASLLTVKGGKDKPDRKFDITADTKITKDDKPATAKDAKDGQWVGGSYKKGEKSNTLLSLNLSAKQKEAKGDEKKPEATTPPKKK